MGFVDVGGVENRARCNEHEGRQHRREQHDQRSLYSGGRGYGLGRDRSIPVWCRCAAYGLVVIIMVVERIWVRAQELLLVALRVPPAVIEQE
jgi:hypothetical protein